MLRSITAAFLMLGASAWGAIFPDQVGAFKKGELKTVGIPDQGLYSEYGLDTAEQAAYASPDGKFMASAWRFRDSTGAMAMFEARRPPGATRSDATPLAVQTSDGVIFAYGNYVFQLTGTLPPAGDLKEFYAKLPKLEQSPLPPLVTDLPVDGLIPNSERYILGPASLDRFFPGMSPSMAAFHEGAEGQVGRYQTAKGLLTLAIFSYPTPNMARERYQEFQKIPGAVARRVGALVAITIAPPDPDAAERILSKVKYDTNLTWNEKVPQNEIKGTAKLIIDIFIFAGLVVGMCLLAGILYGGTRVFARKMNRGEDPDAMITLHLGGK